ncbi:hypothetical protein OB916_01305 [Halobacteria archaeon HArc-curdl5-1]|uniref:IS6 family transposase n=1 Tax=Halapricum hydrolyticum TaxID=2979991 RepID=A0AAE3I985_9EURY|nr:hypothetical protein [Halapricum hydrolyticum]MCU4716703.1 hypothetical protein [Halapricum hydrolyticum]MCU4725692.1 hypothetical protein [Halapricum hydrolyticum]
MAIHKWVHKADLQPISTVTADQLAVDEKMIRLHGQEFWLYGAVDPEMSEILHVSLLPTATKRVFWEVERRTSSFANSFSHVELETAENWLEAFAVYHNSRQT